MTETNTSEFWDGWNQAIESAQTRLDALRQTSDSRTSVQDLFLDFQNELKDLKNINV